MVEGSENVEVHEIVSEDGIDDPYGDQCMSPFNTVGDEGGYEEENNNQFMSPINTIETLDTVVGSNDVSIMKCVEPPKVGMIFKSWQDVESYYKEYAEQQGFGVCRPQGVYSKGEVRERIATTWKCECWDRPDMRATREAKKGAKSMDVSGSGGVVGGFMCVDDLSQRKRKSKKCECMAKVYASLNHDGEWEIKKVHLEHNHNPTPRKSKLVKEYRMRGLTSRTRRRLLDYFEEGVPIAQIHGCFAAEVKGLDNLEFTVKDLSHVVYKERRLKMAGGDAAALMNYFKKMQDGNNNFYHSERLDPEGRLRDVIWVDGRSRAAYEEFGDVVCFDATYLTNEYELPFVNFVGVNHHGQTILLGCALVSREDCDTFRWIFEEWLRCMNNRAPAAILTDQAAAMRKPLEEVMPSTRHRWCIWHIMRKIPDKLGKCARYKYFKGVLKAIVYESLTVDEFETRWASLVDDFNLETNDWLASLYVERHMWVPAFMKEYFWDGMKTTQGVESINSFFDGYVNRKTKLFEFPQKYAKAMDKRVRDETAADANCAKYVRRIVTGFTVEKYFQSKYTDNKFQEVFTRLMYCNCKVNKMLDENTIEYAVEDRVWIVPEGKSEEVLTNRRRYLTTTFNKVTKEVIWQCHKFVTHGIMCNHMMQILEHNVVVEIPEMYNRLMEDFEQLCDAAAMVNDDAVVDTVSNALKQLRSEIEECRLRKAAESIFISFPSEGAHGSCVIFGNSSNAFSSGQNATHPEENATDVNLDNSDVSPPSDMRVKDPVLNKKPRVVGKKNKKTSVKVHDGKQSITKGKGLKLRNSGIKGVTKGKVNGHTKAKQMDKTSKAVQKLKSLNDLVPLVHPPTKVMQKGILEQPIPLL
ncbi:protein FAR1-RELATED SEQUENCE 6-like [Chenopodium quinoa]|uniref:protein FAR1-RELATED SEQUENCE 6-like n=1 Tax=Chenopodium quinoa TaxID=63459 RepID=UPI000B7881AD|nr:protein FAR1-RELATED SEQUENCE 6-like [Chenopodium quinoa]